MPQPRLHAPGRRFDEARPWCVLLAACVLSRLATTVTYIEDPDSLRFALSVADAYDVAALQPHFPGYPVFWAVAKPLYLLTGSFAAAFALVGGFATVGLVAAGMPLLGTTLRTPRGAAWAVLVFFNPLVWLLGNRYMPDLLGLSAALGTTALALRAGASGHPGATRAAAFGAGLLAGLRLSYVPFVLPPLLALLRRPERRLDVVAAGTLGVALWLVPLVLDTGWSALLGAAQQQTTGHFTDFGGTVATVGGGLGLRLLRTFESIWADGLGAWWPGRHPLTAAVAVAALIVGGASVAAWRRGDERLRHAARWLVACAVVYGVWILLYQNVLHKSRHVLPLLAVVLLGMAPGAALLARRVRGRIVLGAGLGAYAAVALVLVAQHREPTAIAQAAAAVRATAAAEPALRVVSIPLATYTLAAQHIDAVFLAIDDVADRARLRADFEAGAPIVAIGAPLPWRGRPVRADTFYHNPYVNRMWSAVSVYAYPSVSRPHPHVPIGP